MKLLFDENLSRKLVVRLAKGLISLFYGKQYQLAFSRQLLGSSDREH